MISLVSSVHKCKSSDGYLLLVMSTHAPIYSNHCRFSRVRVRVRFCLFLMDMHAFWKFWCLVEQNAHTAEHQNSLSTTKSYKHFTPVCENPRRTRKCFAIPSEGPLSWKFNCYFFDICITDKNEFLCIFIICGVTVLTVTKMKSTAKTTSELRCLWWEIQMSSVRWISGSLRIHMPPLNKHLPQFPGQFTSHQWIRIGIDWLEFGSHLKELFNQKLNKWITANKQTESNE